MARCAAHSAIPATMAPDWETSARSPRRGIRVAKLALKFAAGAITPRQFGPTIRRPFPRAARSAASASEPLPCPRAADRTLTRARAHHGDRAREEQFFEPIGRHGGLAWGRVAHNGPGGA